MAQMKEIKGSLFQQVVVSGLKLPLCLHSSLLLQNSVVSGLTKTPEEPKTTSGPWTYLGPVPQPSPYLFSLSNTSLELLCRFSSSTLVCSLMLSSSAFSLLSYSHLFWSL